MCVVVAAVALSVGPALGQSTAFTYQGRLADAGAPADGLHDFRFRLFDAAEGGRQVGETLCADDVEVADGLFTVILDFDQQFATPDERHLDIEVRRDTGLNCSNPSGFVILAPRQQLTATPLASHAESAFALDAADGSPADAVFVDNAGSVGIGTLAPAAPLHVASPVPVLNLQDSDGGPSNQVGLVSFRDVSGVERGWMGFGSSSNPHAHLMNNRAGGNTALGAGGLERLTVTAGGNVGIGTLPPGHRLDVGAGFLGDGIALRGAGSNDPGYHLYEGANSRATLGLALHAGIWSTDAAPGDIVLRSSTGKLLLQNGALGSAVAINGNNVGIGTAAPAAKLDVRGDIRLGPTGQLRATSGEENLRIIRGIVAADGRIIAGSGFAVAHPSLANYVITFNTSFAGLPSVTATAIRPDIDSHGTIVMTDGLRPSSATLVVVVAPEHVHSHIPGSPALATFWRDLQFSFIAVGPR